MTIDWTQLILAVIGIISSGSLTTLAILKYTKRKENIAVKSDDNKEQAERIDLGDKYVSQMLTMIEKLQDAQDKYMHSNENRYYKERCVMELSGNNTINGSEFSNITIYNLLFRW